MENKLRTKDIITIVLMSLINIVIFGFGSFFYLTPITVLLMPVFYSLFQGIVYFMLGVKVPKAWTMLIYCIIQGVIGFNLVYIACYVLAGLLAELILKKLGYGSAKGLTLSYILMQLLAAFGSTFYPYALTLESTLAHSMDTAGGAAESVAKAGEMIQSWGALVLAVVVLIAAFLGALLGKAVCRKHLQRVEDAQ